MFEEKLAARFERLRAEFQTGLYRRYTMQRELKQLEESILRIEAALADVERIKKDWEAQKAIDQAQADKDK